MMCKIQKNGNIYILVKKVSKWVSFLVSDRFPGIEYRIVSIQRRKVPIPSQHVAPLLTLLTLIANAYLQLVIVFDLVSHCFVFILTQ